MEDTHLAKKISKALDPVFIVNYVAALHMKLTDCAHLINKAFALQQLLKLAITFVSIVSALYFIAIHFSNPELRSLDILFVMWALSNAMEAVGIVYVTSETCEEVFRYIFFHFHSLYFITIYKPSSNRQNHSCNMMDSTD